MTYKGITKLILCGATNNILLAPCERKGQVFVPNNATGLTVSQTGTILTVTLAPLSLDSDLRSYKAPSMDLATLSTFIPSTPIVGLSVAKSIIVEKG